MFEENQYKKILYFKTKNSYLNKEYNITIKLSTHLLSIDSSDVEIRLMRARAYKFIGDMELAIQDLECNTFIYKDPRSITELYMVYYSLHRYEDALKLLPYVKKNDYLNSYWVYLSELIMKKELNICIDSIYAKTSDYVTNQIIDYNFDKAIKHVLEHKAENVKKDNESKFNADVNMRYLFEGIANNISNSKIDTTTEILDVYYFAVSNIGLLDDRVCNFIKVIVAPNTKNIISMYPVLSVGSNSICYIEFDYIKLFNGLKKPKTLSMIEKFNNRYNLNK